MPIRPEAKHLYPSNWEEIRKNKLRQVNFRCEGCGVIDRAWGYRDADGEFVMVSIADCLALDSGRPPFNLDGHKIIEIVLTIAHADHDPSNNDPSNLFAWCQKCHLEHDHDHHIQSRYRNQKKGLEIAGQESLNI